MANKCRYFLVAGLLLACSATVATAQDFPQRPRGFNFWQPFGPVDFDYYHDMQPFAPADISMFDNGPGANEGFFFKYQRLNMNLDRPDGSFRHWEGDWGWGNRYEMGYMTRNNHGWLVEVFNMSSGVVERTVNDDVFVDNNIRLSGVAVNKTFRLKPFHYGSIMEPFVGVAYMNATQRFGDDDTRAKNDMYGLHGGLRWYKQLERWTLSTEGRYFVGLNHQSFFTPTAAEQNHDIVYAFDVRVEATYELTKAVALNVGYEMMFFPDKIARGPLAFGSEDLYATGVIFGVSVNR